MSENTPVRIPFHGDDLLVVDIDGKPHVVLKPAIEAIGLDYWPQVEKLRKRSWAALGLRQVQVSDQAQRREMITVDVRTFLMLLATVDEARVAVDVRPKLVAYQAEVADAIEAYWTRGGVINPRASREQLDAIANTARLQADVLRALDGIVDRSWLESKARHLAARALGEEPEDDPARRPLTVGEYLVDRDVTAPAARKLASRFGKALKARYVEEHGQPPGTARRFVDGAQRDVLAYVEADRPLFDQVWQQIAVAV